ncbi:WD40-repeat-containing domain protein [Dipodascopsis uninucleata]
MSPYTASLPIFTVQSDYPNVIADVKSGQQQKESFWVSCYVNDSSRHGSIDVYRIGDDIELRGLDGFDVTLEGNGSLSLACPGFVESIAIFKPPRTLIQTNSNCWLIEIESFDISPQQELYIVGDSDGIANIGSIGSDGSVKRTLEGHRSDITKCLFFPSGQVALTASVDMQIKLWSVIDGSNPRTFVGHKRAVSDLAMIDQGRNFLSASHDSTVRLWECGSSQLLHTFEYTGSDSNATIECTRLSLASRLDTPENFISSSLDFSTKDKMVAVGYNTGEVGIFGVGTRDMLAMVNNMDGSASDITGLVIDGSRLILGKDNKTEIWDFRSLTTPVVSLSLPASITDVALLSSNTLAYATHSDSGFLLDISGEPQIKCYTSGISEGLTVGVCSRDGRSVYYASKQGDIFKY